MDYGKKFREMSDRHAEETGEGFFSGSDANGYYFSFGYFPKSEAAAALVEAQKLRDSVPHVMAEGFDAGKPFTYRQCPEPMCISAPHPDSQHVDYTGTTWRTHRDGSYTITHGHDGE